MKKIIALLVLLSAGLILVTAMDEVFINTIKKDKYFEHLAPEDAKHSLLYRELFLRSDRWKYGDLYGLCYLHPFKQRLSPFRKYDGPMPHKPANRRLYIIGDSYLADKVLNSAFPGFDEVIYLDRRSFTDPIKLDTNKKNYLIMEFAERNLADYRLYKTSETKWSTAEINAKVNLSASLFQKTAPSVAANFFERLGNIIFNKDLSTNIELILFDHKLFTPIKEVKAAINYHLLGRIFPKEVTLSSDKKRLFLTMTVDTTYRESSFRYVANKELKFILGNLDIAANYYRSVGFKGVFLSVIPNTVSVCDNKRMAYNHLLERVERITDLPIISVFNELNQSRQSVFFNSDAHWNPHGFDLWVNSVNCSLNTVFTKKISSTEGHYISSLKNTKK